MTAPVDATSLANLAHRAAMEAGVSLNLEQLDPAYVGAIASAPLADATRRALLVQQTDQKALEDAAAMNQ